jgi:hypothetical protein
MKNVRHGILDDLIFFIDTEPMRSTSIRRSPRVPGAATVSTW